MVVVLASAPRVRALDAVNRHGRPGPPAGTSPAGGGRGGNRAAGGVTRAGPRGPGVPPPDPAPGGWQHRRGGLASCRMTSLTGRAAALVAPGKGILAADEGPRAIAARLTAAGVRAAPQNRLAWRELLVTTP